MVDQTEQTEDKPLVPGTPEYDAAMIAKFRGEDVAPATGGEQEDASPKRPDDVPEKFWDAEKGQVDVAKLLKSYSELEAAKGAPKEDKPAEAPAGDPAAADAAKETVEKAGLDWDAVIAKVRTNGDIDAADYEALEKSGIPRSLVEEVIESRKANVERERAAAIEYIGGEKEATDLLKWAGENLSPEDKAAYQGMLDGPHWRVAVDALKARRASNVKTAGEPQLETGRSTGTVGTVGYTSREEMKADMANPLYHAKTPDGERFRAQVYKRAELASYRK
ncbi:hypothetical protein [Xanthobacter wiegelii]|uniref:hypothetical protein n=1 Tax=Xanthobacter wiegelii TaxID=3119913 RepID=UPI003728EFF6